MRKVPAQQRSRDMVEFILEAAARVFDREGITATTNRIAEEAGVSIGSLYQYFPDKHALLHELGRRHLASAAQAVDQALEGSTRSRSELATCIQNLVTLVVALHEDQPQLHRVIREHAIEDPQITTAFMTFETRTTDRIASSLDDLGIEDAHGRARLAFDSLDAMLHRTLAASGSNHSRADLAAGQINGLLGLT